MMDPAAEAAAAVGDDRVLENDTRHIISSVLMDFAGVIHIPSGHQSEAQSTMKRVVEDLVEKHRFFYNGMINKFRLRLDEGGDDMRSVGQVAMAIFGDGTTNWGRIASLVAFGAVVCRHLIEEENRDPSAVRLVGQEISTYLLNDQREWLLKNNAWDGFVEFFRASDPESSARSELLMAAAGFAGIGLTLGLLIRCVGRNIL